ncbi:MAG TPA: hypothetical protein VF713_11435, partial [Thermoanaerobaculia bacterium]
MARDYITRVVSSSLPMHSASEVIATIRADMIVSVIAAVLCTMGAGMLLLGWLSERKARASFLYTGLFAIAYGTRLIFNTSSFALLLGRPRWLDYVRSAFEYLVPIPAAALFEAFSGDRRRTLHRIITSALIVCAAVAIPYEILTHSPYALKSVIDALAVALMAVLTLDLLAPGTATANWRLIRI